MRDTLRRATPARWLQFIACVHVLYGAVAYRTELGDIIGSGVLAAVPDRGERATAFWFLLGAPLMWLTGHLLHRAEQRSDHEAQRVTGAVVLATSAVAVVLMPASPFWLVGAVGAAALRRGVRAEP